MAATAFISVAAILALTGSFAIVRALIGDRAKGRKRCPKCWYDMRAATSLICPECGHDAGAPTKLLRTRRHFRTIAFAIVLFGVAVHLGLVSSRIHYDKEEIRYALVPTTLYAVAWPELGPTWQDAALRRIKRVRLDLTAFGPIRVAMPPGDLERVMQARPVAWAWQGRLFVHRGVGVKCDPRRRSTVSATDIMAVVSFELIVE